MYASRGSKVAAGRTVDPRVLGRLAFLPILLFAAFGDLWAPDEPRYAEVAREAYRGGGLLVMHLNGELYPDKPPLLYWLAGGAGALGGWSEFALRLPSLLATLGSAWIASRLARRFWGEAEARWAPVLYLSTVMVTYIGGRLQIDPLLGFLCIASLDLASAEPRPRMAAAGLLAGLAALAKGPVAWVHVLLPLAAWSLLPRHARSSMRRPARSWIAFAILAVLPVAAWALAATVAEPGLGRDLFFGQHLGRAIEGTSHPAPPWQYVLDVPVQLLPWTAFFVAACVRAVRELRRARSGEPADAGLLRAAAWFLAVFVFFSLLTSKRGLYLLPIYPAAALLCARELALLEAGSSLPRAIRWATGVVLLLAGIVLVGVPALPGAVAAAGLDAPKELDALHLLGIRPALVGVPLVLAALAALPSRVRAAGLASRVAAGFAIAGVLYATTLVPAINPAKSAREIALWLAGRPEAPTAIACWGVRPEGYRFYGGVPAVAEELLPALEREGREFLGLVDRKDWGRLSEADRARFRILLEQGVGGRDVIVLGAGESER